MAAGVVSRRRSRGRTLCMTPSKLALPDLEACQAAYDAEAAAFKYREPAMYAYLCRCGSWHRSNLKGNQAVALDGRH